VIFILQNVILILLSIVLLFVTCLYLFFLGCKTSLLVAWSLLNEYTLIIFCINI